MGVHADNKVLRDQMIQFIRDAGVPVSVVRLAREFSITERRVRDHLKGARQRGELVTVNDGRYGIKLRMPTDLELLTGVARKPREVRIKPTGKDGSKPTIIRKVAEQLGMAPDPLIWLSFGRSV